jgi:multiple sugar transport system ATP-binding protein
MSEIIFEHVTKTFGDDVVAVDDLSLEVVDEEFMVFLGPSGCGKTTALRMVAGLETVTSGTIRIGGDVVNEVEAKDRNISMVFQSYALYPHMTVAKNIESPLMARKFEVDADQPARKLQKDERRERVNDAARSLGLSELLDRKPAALSGGQRQRVALARAIVSRPAAFLMDEPLSNLDAKLRAQTRLELVELHQRVGTTFIYVTHDQVEAMTMATRIAVMSEGLLQQVGPPQEVYERPTNLFVARFIGSPPMNTIAATFVIRDGQALLEVGGGQLPLARGAPLTAADGDAVVLGVRPEHLQIGPGEVEATIVAVEWLGHERHIVCDLAGEKVRVREAASAGLRTAGEQVRLAIAPDQVHLFDPETTDRLN